MQNALIFKEQLILHFCRPERELCCDFAHFANKHKKSNNFEGIAALLDFKGLPKTLAHCCTLVARGLC